MYIFDGKSVARFNGLATKATTQITSKLHVPLQA
jgi:hypothetical protein